MSTDQESESSGFADPPLSPGPPIFNQTAGGSSRGSGESTDNTSISQNRGGTSESSQSEHLPPRKRPRLGENVENSPPPNDVPPTESADVAISGLEVVDHPRHPGVTGAGEPPATSGLEDATPDTSSHPFGPPPFLTLPLELLSEILISSGSPQHVLAVARTCKALWSTLTAENARIIWREARLGPGCVFPATDKMVEEQVVALPDPVKEVFGGSEANFAAFIFDGGKCEVCGKETEMMFQIFALRLRLCKTQKCQRTDITELGDILNLGDQTPAIHQILPVVTERFSMTGPYFRICRQSDMEAAKASYLCHLAGEEPEKKIEALKDRKTKWMEYCTQVALWRKRRDCRYQLIKRANNEASKKFASKFGWEHGDMLNCTIYGPYHHQKNKLIETVNERDVEVMRDEIDSQLLAISEKHQRRDDQVALIKNQKEIKEQYDRMCSDKIKYPVLPSLSAFRQLPVISLLGAATEANGETSVSHTLRHNLLMHNLLNEQLKKWVTQAKDELCFALGFPRGWKSASRNLLHPVERVTARFICTKPGCNGRLEVRYRADECLDFAGACRHECGVGNIKKDRVRQGKKAQHDMKTFKKDEQAISALRKYIAALGYDENKGGAHELITHGVAVMCNSCEPPMVLDSRSIVGHSHRHETMDLSFDFTPEILANRLGGYPFEFGLAQKLLVSSRHSYRGKEALGKKNFGCRYCLRASQISELTEEQANEPTVAPNVLQVQLSTIALRPWEVGIEGPRNKPPTLFNFNGMRSHLSSKHGFGNIRDEDFFCYDSVDL